MNENAVNKPVIYNDPRVPLAAERTMLAWIRTGLALMGFGFVVARFSLFMREIANVNPDAPAVKHGFSPYLGVALIALGVIVNIMAALKYRRYLKSLAMGEMPKSSSYIEIALAIILAMIGVFTVAYLLWIS